MNNVWTRTEKQGILEDDSIESDFREKSVVNETADWFIVWNHSKMGDFSKY